MFTLLTRARVALAVLAMTATPLLVGASEAEAATVNYGQFSLLDQRYAGQAWANGAPATQWAWSPQSPTVSHVQWGDPNAWPPANDERFERDGDWVLLSGYGDNTTGELLRQVVTREQIGDVNCRNMKPLPDAGGRQHYVKWNVPSSAYCLEAWGLMTHQGQRIDFYHRQVWFPPSGPTCTNRYFSGRVCIKQYEVWLDTLNPVTGTISGPLVERHRRDNVLAKGLGPAFIAHDYRTGWHADLRYSWPW